VVEVFLKSRKMNKSKLNIEHAAAENTTVIIAFLGSESSQG